MPLKLLQCYLFSSMRDKYAGTGGKDMHIGKYLKE